jgi:hypothetical protein
MKYTLALRITGVQPADRAQSLPLLPASPPPQSEPELSLPLPASQFAPSPPDHREPSSLDPLSADDQKTEPPSLLLE